MECALKQMALTKAPRLDMICPLISQLYLGIVSDVMSRDVLRVLNSKTMALNLNKALISLTSKMKNPKTLKEVRLISLCNVAYRLI